MTYQRFEDLPVWQEAKRYNTWEKVAMYFIPVIFLLIMVLIGVLNKNYTPEGFWIFRVVLALMGGAFTGIAIPGSIKIEGKVGNFAIKAVGAVAVTVMIYLLNPPALLKNSSTTTNQSEKSQKWVSSWL
jgi:ACR3 family arsenite efflux pump ArsB